MNCWFCRNGPTTPGRKDQVRLPQPDGKPLCDYCRNQLAEFLGWLRERIA